MSAESLKEARRTARLLEEARTRHLPMWKEAARWVAPWRGRFGAEYGAGQAETTESGNPHILDATAVRALRILTAGLQSGLTSPARPWFRLRRGGNEESESGPERRWLDSVEAALYALFAGSNFYQAMHGLYTELAVFGSGDLYVESDPKRHVNFSVLTAGEYAWAAGPDGTVDTVLRRMLMTPRQMAARYGEERLSPRTAKALENAPDAPLEVMHLVRPRQTRNPALRDRLHMPYASLVFEADGQAEGLLHEGGFQEFPHLCARWDVLSGEVYGRGPAAETLPDIRMLQEMVKSRLLAVHKVVNPPMRVPAGFKQRLSLIPGAVNFVSPNQPDGIGPLYQINPDLSALSRQIEEVRESVRQGFFTDLLLMFAGEGRSNVTAAEIAQRGEEKLLMLGPVIERHQAEILSPLLARVFGIAERAGLLPPPPHSLEGTEIKVEYVSAFAQAQRMGGADAIRRLMGEVANILPMCPGVLDKIDFEQAVDELASIVGVPSRIIRSDAEVEDLRQTREEEKAAALAAQNSLASLGGLAPGEGGAESLAGLLSGLEGADGLEARLSGAASAAEIEAPASGSAPEAVEGGENG